jgi:hypothetical protein
VRECFEIKLDHNFFEPVSVQDIAVLELETFEVDWKLENSLTAGLCQVQCCQGPRQSSHPHNMIKSPVKSSIISGNGVFKRAANSGLTSSKSSSSSSTLRFIMSA